MTGCGRITLVLCMLLIVTGCGRKGPLIYPDMMVPAAPAIVSVQQCGSAVKLQFVLPGKDRGGRSVKGLSGIKISRRVTETDRKDVCRSCMSDYRLFQTLYLDHLPAAIQRFGSQLILFDGDVASGNSYSYSLIPFTEEGADGASHTTVDVRVVAPLPAPALKIESLPTEIRLLITMQSLVSNQLLGYNLYRSTGGAQRSYQPLNPELVQGSEYIDSGLDRRTKYRYSARALIKMESGNIVESAESFEVEGMLKDDE